MLTLKRCGKTHYCYQEPDDLMTLQNINELITATEKKAKKNNNSPTVLRRSKKKNLTCCFKLTFTKVRFLYASVFCPKQSESKIAKCNSELYDCVL